MSLYGTEVVGAHWPLDGPHTPELAESAGALAELVRYLNRATMPPNNVLTGAPHVAGLLGSLATAASRQQQLCRQLSASARQLAADPTLRHDQCGNDADISRLQAVSRANNAAGELRSAVDIAEELATYIGRARTEVEWLSHARPGGGSA